MPQDWTTMTSEEKIDMFTAVLTAAATDLSLRDRLLESPDTALAALREFNETQEKPVSFPQEFSIEFLAPQQTAKTTATVLMKIPPYYPNVEVPEIPIEEHLLCTYNYWKDLVPARWGDGK